MKSTSAGRQRSPLAELEHVVMEVVWESGPASVEQVHGVVSRARPLKEATTRTILRRLEQKGYVVHSTEGRAYIYGAVEPRHGIAATAARHLIDRFCRGSLEALVSGMVDARLLSDRELAEVEAMIRSRRAATAAKKRKGR